MKACVFQSIQCSVMRILQLFYLSRSMNNSVRMKDLGGKWLVHKMIHPPGNYRKCLIMPGCSMLGYPIASFSPFLVLCASIWPFLSFSSLRDSFLCFLSLCGLYTQIRMCMLSIEIKLHTCPRNRSPMI